MPETYGPVASSPHTVRRAGGSLFGSSVNESVAKSTIRTPDPITLPLLEMTLADVLRSLIGTYGIEEVAETLDTLASPNSGV